MQSVCCETGFFWAKAHKARAPKEALCALEFGSLRFQIQLTKRADFLCSNALHRNSPFGGGWELLAILSAACGEIGAYLFVNESTGNGDLNGLHENLNVAGQTDGLTAAGLRGIIHFWTILGLLGPHRSREADAHSFSTSD